MMKKILVTTAIAAGVFAGSAQAAPIVTTTFTGGSGTQPANSYVIQNFDSLAPGAQIGTNAFAYLANTGSAVRPAYGSTGNFGAVQANGSYSINFSATTLFSFVVGSLDTFNTLTLNFADGTSAILNGGAIVGNSGLFDSGNRTVAQTNGVVTYTIAPGSGGFVGATFTSAGTNSNSFEFDNIAAGVPEPAAWGMMILGFGLVGGVMRRRRQAVQFKFA